MNDRKGIGQAERMKREGDRDNPEQYPTDKTSLHDLHEEELNVDTLPLEDIKLERQEEKRRDGVEKHRSSSERKYHSGFED